MSDSDLERWLPHTAAAPAPHTEAGCAVRGRLLRALVGQNPQAAWDAIMRCGWEVEAQDRLRAAWLPCLSGCDELRAQGRPVPRERVLEACVRDRIRDDLGRLPADVRPLWVVPVAAGDDAFAYLTAAILSQRGRIARPWLWSHLPARAPYLTVGARPRPELSEELHVGHVTLRPHDVFWDVGTLVAGSVDVERIGRGSQRLRSPG